MTSSNRPHFHFTPAENWMNDPNGLVYHDGEYHLFFQHNPFGREWNNMSWGHAVSPDLLRWTHLPVAILENKDRDFGIWSGSAVADQGNTSGLGSADGPPLIAVFTARHNKGGLQDIHIASSTDRGRTFTEYKENPVITVGDTKFGDPKVIRHEESNQWVMVNIRGGKQGCIEFYGSPNLREWIFLSRFEAAEEAPDMWECPDLFCLPLDGDPANPKWVLKVNTARWEEGVTKTRYFVGQFDGRSFIRDNAPVVAAVPDADPYYAEVTYNLPAGDPRVIQFGWLRQQPHDSRPWTGMQSFPRMLSLRTAADGYCLLQQPIPEIEQLRSERANLKLPHLHLVSPADLHQPLRASCLAPSCSGTRECSERAKNEVQAEESLPISIDGADGIFEFCVFLDSSESPGCGVSVRFGENTVVKLGYCVDDGMIRLQKNEDPPTEIPLAIPADDVKLHVLADRRVVEVFFGNGERATTFISDEEPTITALSIFSAGGPVRVKDATLWALQ